MAGVGVATGLLAKISPLMPLQQARALLDTLKERGVTSRIILPGSSTWNLPEDCYPSLWSLRTARANGGVGEPARAAR